MMCFYTILRRLLVFATEKGASKVKLVAFCLDIIMRINACYNNNDQQLLHGTVKRFLADIVGIMGNGEKN